MRKEIRDRAFLVLVVVLTGIATYLLSPYIRVGVRQVERMFESESERMHSAPEPDDLDIAVKVLQEQVDRLSNKAFIAMVPDSLVMKMAREYIGSAGPVTWIATHTVCDELFQNEFYNRLPEMDECYWPGCDYPSDLDKLGKRGRQIILDKAKAYFAQPDNLRTFYSSKKPIILRELKRALKESRMEDYPKELLDWMTGLTGAIKALEKPEFEQAYQDYLRAEQTLIREHSEYTSTFGPDNGVSTFLHLNSGLEPNKKDLAIPEFAEFVAAEKKLASLTPDFDATLFAARRRAENPDILPVYLEILADMRKEVEAL